MLPLVRASFYYKLPITAWPTYHHVLGTFRLATSADMTEFRSGKASDIISTLVSIYDSREVIVKELQVLLATRLLAVKDYDSVKEVCSGSLGFSRFLAMSCAPQTVALNIGNRVS